MDTQWPRYQLLGGLHRNRQQKRCYDITLSREQGTMTRHFARTQSDRPACVCIMHSYNTTFSVVWRAGLRRPD